MNTPEDNQLFNEWNLIRDGLIGYIRYHKRPINNANVFLWDHWHILAPRNRPRVRMIVDAMFHGPPKFWESDARFGKVGLYWDFMRNAAIAYEESGRPGPIEPILYRALEDMTADEHSAALEMLDLGGFFAPPMNDAA